MQCDARGERDKVFPSISSSLAFRDEKMSARLGDEKLDNEARDEKFV